MEKELKSQVASKITGGIWLGLVMVTKGMVANIIIMQRIIIIFMLLGNKLLDDGVEEEVILALESPPTTQNGYGP